MNPEFGPARKNRFVVVSGDPAYKDYDRDRFLAFLSGMKGFELRIVSFQHDELDVLCGRLTGMPVDVSVPAFDDEDLAALRRAEVVVFTRDGRPETAPTVAEDHFRLAEFNNRADRAVMAIVGPRNFTPAIMSYGTFESRVASGPAVPIESTLAGNHAATHPEFAVSPSMDVAGEGA